MKMHEIAELRDLDDLDPIEALVADIAALEGVARVHEGSGYYAERVIRRAIEQGKLLLTDAALDGFCVPQPLSPSRNSTHE